MFDFLTQPNYPKAAIGIEQNAISALQLRREGRGRFGVDRAATVELPRHLVTPSFTDRNISSIPEFGALLEEAVVSAGLLSQKSWSISLPSSTARSAILTLDNASKGDLDEILEWKAEQSFGAPSAQLRITKYQISNDREGKQRYFATAVKLSVIDEYETVFEQFGWKAGLILPRAVAETNWLLNESTAMDSLLISSQSDGFTAVLLRGNEPSVVRSVTCAPNEIDDEVYRLLMFYNDRFSDAQGGNLLSRLLLIGRDLVPEKIRAISADAFGRTLAIVRSEDVGLNVPVGSLSFDDLAAPAGLAAFGWR
jgi:Tfp pilus assembly PilM family ATPase